LNSTISEDDMKTLILDKLKEGLPTLTETWGRFLVEAALFCFESQGHKSGVKLTVKGSSNEIYPILWEGHITDKMRKSWGDQEEGVEYGATCVAILLAIRKTKYTTVERSIKGTGFDYWLGDKEDFGSLPFQRKARLEISGIRKGDGSDINRRVNLKVEQIKRSDDTGFPAYILVVEFSNPTSRFIEK
jgi:hypothetical protein